MSKICKKRVHRNEKINLPCAFNTCPGSLHFTLLTWICQTSCDSFYFGIAIIQFKCLWRKGSLKHNLFVNTSSIYLDKASKIRRLKLQFKIYFWATVNEKRMIWTWCSKCDTWKLKRKSHVCRDLCLKHFLQHWQTYYDMFRNTFQ